MPPQSLSHLEARKLAVACRKGRYVNCQAAPIAHRHTPQWQELVVTARKWPLGDGLPEPVKAISKGYQ